MIIGDEKLGIYLILTNLGFLLAVGLLIFLLAGRQETTQI
ncbi:UNVERIFIED_ORG: hypothetical protein J3A77_000522 [Bacillus sp. PvP124]|nr:hypothetical protein [Bacillus sp. PvP124]MDP9579395.1 hypothetical protein [Bacillus sp. 1751]